MYQIKEINLIKDHWLVFKFLNPSGDHATRRRSTSLRSSTADDDDGVVVVGDTGIYVVLLLRLTFFTQLPLYFQFSSWFII